MRRFFRSKLFISIILLVMAALLTFVFLPKLYGSQSETIDIVQFIDDVNVGTKISPDMLATKTIGRYGVDASVIKTKEEIVGKYAANDIRRDTNLYSDQFVDQFEEADGAVDTLLQPGDKLITVSLASGASSVGGMVKNGMYVDVLTEKPSEGYSENVDMELVELLRNVRVYCLQNSAMEDIAALQRQWKSLLELNNGSETSFDSSLVPAFATLIVNDEQAVKLANEEYSGTIHLVLHPNIEGATCWRTPPRRSSARRPWRTPCGTCGRGSTIRRSAPRRSRPSPGSKAGRSTMRWTTSPARRP